jgi:hypothetical protein
MSFARYASRIPSAAGTVNSTLAAGRPAKLYSVNGQNARAGVVYIKLYNKATAPTVGTDVPVLTFACAASSPFSFQIPNGFLFTVGLGYGMTTGAADNSTAALTAADVLGLNVMFG